MLIHFFCMNLKSQHSVTCLLCLYVFVKEEGKSSGSNSVFLPKISVWIDLCSLCKNAV